MDDFIAQAGAGVVRVRSPQSAELAALLAGHRVTVREVAVGVLDVIGLSTDEVGIAAASAHLTVLKLSSKGASLEEAYVALTQDRSSSNRIATTRWPRERRGGCRRDPGSSRAESQPVTLSRAVRSEWIKFKTLRSSWAILGGAVLAMVVIALIVAYNTRHLTAYLQPDDLAPSATLQGYYLGQLLIGALGVLFVRGECSTGMIRSALAAVPKRSFVLWAKLGVFVTVVALTMIPVSVIAFVAAQGAISRTSVGYSMHDPGVLRIVIGTGIYLTFVGVIGAAIGWIVRSTPGAIVTYAAVILVIPGIFEGLLGTWGREIARYLAQSRGCELLNATFVDSGPNLKPWTGLAVMTLWVGGGLAIALVELRRRDA